MVVFLPQAADSTFKKDYNFRSNPTNIWSFLFGEGFM